MGQAEQGFDRQLARYTSHGNGELLVMATSAQLSTSGEALFLPDRQKHDSSVDISSLFSTGVLTRCDHSDGWQDQLTPQEKIQIGDVCEKRYAEFAAGRSQARQLIAALTGIAEPVLIGDYRQPLWPETVIGSISHSDKYCAVAVAPVNALTGIGIDVESFEALDEDVADVVITDKERAATREFDRIFEQSGRLPLGESQSVGQVQMVDGGLPGSHAVSEKTHKLIFSIKEAVYKCCYPQVRAFIDFKQCEVSLDLQSRTHSSVIDCEDATGKPVHLHITGKWMIGCGHIFASAELT